MKAVMNQNYLFNFSFLLFLLIILSSPDIKPQDPMVQFDGIPLVIYPEKPTELFTHENFAQMESLGVFGVVTADVFDNSSWLSTFEEHHLKVLPQYWDGDTTSGQHLIERYTNSHYTVWEAEGTNPANGKVALSYDTIYTSPFTEINGQDIIKGRYAVGTSVPNNDTIIFGPGYPQNVIYNAPEDNRKVSYTVEYRMKISLNDPNITPDPDAIVCTIQVTNLKNEGKDEVLVTEKDIQVSDFGGLNIWKTITADEYEFSASTSEEVWRMMGIKLLPKAVAECVQFKVIWRGLTYLNFYIDKITVSDYKGRQLIHTSGPRLSISNLIQTNISNHTIAGWYGTDEPISIDNYEPFRVVDSVIAAVSVENNFPIRLHAGLTGGASGTYSPWVNVIHKFALDKYQEEEFWLRAHPKNIQINCYNYYYPFKPGDPEHPNYVEDDIDYVTNTYLDRINDYDTSFSFSLQTGAWYRYDDNCNLTETFLIYPSPAQMNYNTNLALLYGARELRCDPFFFKL